MRISTLVKYIFISKVFIWGLIFSIFFISYIYLSNFLSTKEVNILYKSENTEQEIKFHPTSTPIKKIKIEWKLLDTCDLNVSAKLPSGFEYLDSVSYLKVDTKLKTVVGFFLNGETKTLWFYNLKQIRKLSIPLFIKANRGIAVNRNYACFYEEENNYYINMKNYNKVEVKVSEKNLGNLDLLLCECEQTRLIN